MTDQFSTIGQQITQAYNELESASQKAEEARKKEELEERERLEKKAQELKEEKRAQGVKDMEAGSAILARMKQVSQMLQDTMLAAKTMQETQVETQEMVQSGHGRKRANSTNTASGSVEGGAKKTKAPDQDDADGDVSMRQAGQESTERANSPPDVS